MRRYYFNVRRGKELSRDWRGMWLPNLEAARKEALQAWADLAAIVRLSGEEKDFRYEVSGENGDILLKIPFSTDCRLH